MANLRAVGPDEKAPRKKPLTIIEAIEAGDRVAELEAMHRRIGLAVQNEDTPARDLAALTRRQFEIGKELEAMRRAQIEEAKEGAVSEDEVWSEEAI